MTYKQLPMIEVPLSKLNLDLDNYRIPTSPADEAAALNFLFVSEDVLDQAKLILHDGYFDNEVPIVVRAGGGKYTVLEGNRRVSALKALADPKLVPDHETQVRALLTRYATEAKSLPKKIRVLEVPSRQAAEPHIARLHTGNPKKRWTLDQQANFYYSLLGPKTTVDDLKAAYPSVRIPRFIRMAVMRRFLGGVKFKDHSLHAYVTGPDLAMSVFEYAYRNKAIATAMGVEFDADGHLMPRRKSPSTIGADITVKQRKAVEYLMTEFRADRLNTRSAAFTQGKVEQQQLVDKLLGNKPTPGGGTPPPPDPDPDPDPDDTPDPDPEPDGGGGGGGSRGPNHPSSKDTLPLETLDYSKVSVNLQHRYQELRKLSLSSTPAAAAIMLRSVLEATIKYHFEGTATPVQGELGGIMNTVDDTYKKDKALLATINTIRSGGINKPGSVTWFNVVTHSADIDVDKASVHTAFVTVAPLLRRLLRP